MKKAEKIEKEPFEASYKDVIEVNATVGKMSNTKGFPSEAMLKLLDFKTELQSLSEKYQKVFAEIMSHYEIKEDKGAFNWAEHENVEEISNKVMELLLTKVELQNVKFLDGTQFVQITEGLSFDVLGFLSKFLRK